jgi:transketolase
MKLTVKEIEKRATEIRKDIIKMLVEAGVGHSAGSLGSVEIFASLYFGGEMNYDPGRPKWEERDRLVLSAGHICPAQYATMAEAGFFEKKELLTLGKLGTRLQGHPHNLSLPGIETSSGPVGQGFSVAVGMALAAKMNKEPWRVFLISSDGEQDEGMTWEGVMFAAKYKLFNLIGLMDRNDIQIDGRTSEVMPLEPLVAKYKAFNWRVFEIDGHDIKKIIETIKLAKKEKEKPTMIICKTIPGKEVSFIEGDYHWHGRAPSKEEGQRALEELGDL